MKFKRRKIRRGRVEVIPMIDTIVILLIFYMCFARVAEMGREASIKLPISVAGDNFHKLPNQVIVNMLTGNDISIGGQSYTMADLPGVLSSLKQTDPDLSLILRGSRDMAYRDLSDLMNACAKAEISDVTFATLENQEPQ